MKKFFCFLFFYLFTMTIFLSNSFYISTIEMNDDFLENAGKIYGFQNSEYFTASNLTLCTGNISYSSLFNIYSEINQNNPSSQILGVLNTDAILPNSYDVMNMRLGDIKVSNHSIPLLVSDNTPDPNFIAYKIFDILGKRICVLNITAIPSDWYEKVSSSLNFKDMDYMVFFMDNPDVGIIPQNLRSKSVVLGRKTSVYRVDLQYGILLTEMNLPQSEINETTLYSVSENFKNWKNTPLDIDKYDYQYYFGISFYNNLALMLKSTFSSELVMIEHSDRLKEKIYPEDLVSMFSEYVVSVVHLENSSIRKLLERSSSNIEYDGININTKVSDYYLSIYGEPYYIDITQIKGERVIIKTFDKSQKIVVFMKKENKDKLFPKSKTEEVSTLPYVFWSAGAANASISPSWRAVALPYFSNYIVQEGDTISEIARKLGITVNSIKTYNPDVIDMYLVPGSYLRVHVPYEFE